MHLRTLNIGNKCAKVRDLIGMPFSIGDIFQALYNDCLSPSLIKLGSHTLLLLGQQFTTSCPHLPNPRNWTPTLVVLGQQFIRCFEISQSVGIITVSH